jgi:microcystin-dependent protein
MRRQFGIAKRSFVMLAVTAAIGSAIAFQPREAAASEPFLAEIRIFAGNFAPAGFAKCDGQLLPISQNTAVFALIGTIYGGDGETTFALPDLRGRVAVHQGSGPGLQPIQIGERGGANNHTLTVQQMPSHTHTATAIAKASGGTGNTSDPTSARHAKKNRTNIYDTGAAADVEMKADSVSVTVANTGNGQSFGIMQPFLGVNYIIALQGIFPSES